MTQYEWDPKLFAKMKYSIDDLAMCCYGEEMEGGKILMPKTQISPEIGYMAFFADTEGNRVAVHSQE